MKTIRVFYILAWAEDHVAHDAYGAREAHTEVRRINETHRISTADQGDLIKATCAAVAELNARTFVGADLNAP